MDNRCTIVVRLTTADGVTAETYSGDTDLVAREGPELLVSGGIPGRQCVMAGP